MAAANAGRAAKAAKRAQEAGVTPVAPVDAQPPAEPAPAPIVQPAAVPEPVPDVPPIIPDGAPAPDPGPQEERPEELPTGGMHAFTMLFAAILTILDVPLVPAQQVVEQNANGPEAESDDEGGIPLPIICQICIRCLKQLVSAWADGNGIASINSCPCVRNVASIRCGRCASLNKECLLVSFGYYCFSTAFYLR